MAIARVNQTELFFESVGAGEPCLVLHGGPGLDHSYLRPWLDPLSERLRLVFYDQRGNGRSMLGMDEGPGFDQLCQDADALREAVSAERMTLLGHSFGGFVALEYALRYPQRVSRLILVDSAPSFDYGAEIEASIMRRQPSAAILAAVSAPPPETDAAFADMWRAVLPLYFHRYDAALAEGAFSATIYRASAAAWGGALFAAYNVASHLGAIRTPTLVVVGEDDVICPPSQAQRLREGIPDAELALLPACGHFPFIERSDAFLQTVDQWLAQHGPHDQ